MTKIMKQLNLVLLLIAFALALAAPAFGQTTDNSTWNGGTGFWTVSSEWTTNGQLGTVYPNNTASTVFNVTIDSGQQDIVTLTEPPSVTINSLTLDGNPNFSSTLAVGENGGAAGMLTIGSNSSAASLTVSSLGNLELNAQSELLLNIVSGNGTVTNNGIINVGSASGTAKLGIFDSASVNNFLSLNGTGTLTLAAGSAILGGNGNEIFTNNSFIQGAGTISNLFLENNGTIDANGTAPLVIDPNPNPVPIEGLGAHSGTGFFNGGTAEVSAGSTLVLNTTAATNTEAPIVNAHGVIQVGDGGTLEVVGAANHTTGFGNAFGAQINVGGTGLGGTLQFDGDNATFDLTPDSASAATLTLSDNANNVITGVTGTETLINDVGETLSGAGTISNLTLVNNGTIIDNATANVLLIEPNSGGFTNNGTLQVNSGSTLRLIGSATSTNSATVTVDGTLDLFSSTLTFNLAGGNGAVTDNGAIELLGSSLLLSDAGNAHSFTLNGTGTLTMQPGSVIQGVSGDEELINSSTIQGSGTISNVGVFNEGTIIANGTSPLIITANTNQNDQGFQNSAFVQVDAGSTLDLDASAATTAANQIFNSRTITVNDGGTLEFTGSADQFVKVLNSLGSPAAIDIGGSGAGGTLELNGSNAFFDVYGSGGLITLSDNANNLITGVTGTETFVNDTGQTLSGAGTISNLALVNNGTILANGTNALDIVPNASTFVNNGTLQANSGSTLVIDTTAATNAHAPFGGFLSKGTVAVQDGGTLEFKDTSGGEAVLGNFGGGALIVGGAGAGGTLEFDGANALFDLTNEGSNEGGGTLTLSDNAHNVITGVTGTETFINDTGETLSGAGTISDLALVNNGTIIANDTNALNITPNSAGFTNNGTVQVNAGSTLNSSGVYTQNAGQTDVNGTLIAASLTIKGGTLASGGGIVETPSLTNGTMITADSTGFIGVGSGKFTATTGYQQLADGTLVELISGASTFGTIDVTGPASLDGTLEVTLENGFIPTVGDQFAFLDFTPGDLTGTFADFLDSTFDNGAGKWGLDYNNSGGDLVLTAEANTTTTTPEPASVLLIGTGLLGLGLLAKKKSWRAIRG